MCLQLTCQLVPVVSLLTLLQVTSLAADFVLNMVEVPSLGTRDTLILRCVYLTPCLKHSKPLDSLQACY